VLYSSLLSELPWLNHGFGTRDDTPPLQKMATVKQIHSAMVWVVQQPGCAGEGDALVTDQAGLSVSVRTADCFPVLLADQRCRAVAAVHAGWRGTAAGIVGETIQRMHAQFGTDAEDLLVAIGPGIGACCYEVGLEVALRFGLECAGCIDLAEINRLQLVAAGAVESKIDTVGGCTKCDPLRFHSFRRDHENAGRMVSFVTRI
jgi:YfiH family protein